MARLKVFGGLLMTSKGQRRTFVATTSQVKAAALLGVTMGDMRGFWSETGNEVECALALASPGQPFQSTSSNIGGDYVPIPARNH